MTVPITLSYIDERKLILFCHGNHNLFSVRDFRNACSASHVSGLRLRNYVVTDAYALAIARFSRFAIGKLAISRNPRILDSRTRLIASCDGGELQQSSRISPFTGVQHTRYYRFRSVDLRRTIPTYSLQIHNCRYITASCTNREIGVTCASINNCAVN